MGTTSDMKALTISDFRFSNASGFLISTHSCGATITQ